MTWCWLFVCVIWNDNCIDNATVYLLQVNLLLKEYLSSGDVTEATRCLKELDVPHFHHEFVYEVRVCVNCAEKWARVIHHIVI